MIVYCVKWRGRKWTGRFAYCSMDEVIMKNTVLACVGGRVDWVGEEYVLAEGG